MFYSELLNKAPAQTLAWLEDPKGKDFFSFLQTLYDRNEHTLRNRIEPYEFYRAQGAMSVLESILGMREDLLKAIRKEYDNELVGRPA